MAFPGDAPTNEKSLLHTIKIAQRGVKTSSCDVCGKSAVDPAVKLMHCDRCRGVHCTRRTSTSTVAHVVVFVVVVAIFFCSWRVLLVIVVVVVVVVFVVRGCCCCC